jgi:hypothetical protein
MQELFILLCSPSWRVGHVLIGHITVIEVHENMTTLMLALNWADLDKHPTAASPMTKP